MNENKTKGTSPCHLRSGKHVLCEKTHVSEEFSIRNATLLDTLIGRLG